MRVAILTVSDEVAEGERADLCGPLLHKLVAQAGGTVSCSDAVPADRAAITAWLCRVIDEHAVDLVLTAGGAELGPRDFTPEATLDVLERQVPGIAEALRAAGLATSARAMLWRGVAGLVGDVLVVNLAGNPKALTEQWNVVAPAIMLAVASARGPRHP